MVRGNKVRASARVARPCEENKGPRGAARCVAQRGESDVQVAENKKARELVQRPGPGEAWRRTVSDSDQPSGLSGPGDRHLGAFPSNTGHCADCKTTGCTDGIQDDFIGQGDFAAHATAPGTCHRASHAACPHGHACWMARQSVLGGVVEHEGFLSGRL